MKEKLESRMALLQESFLGSERLRVMGHLLFRLLKSLRG